MEWSIVADDDVNPRQDGNAPNLHDNQVNPEEKSSVENLLQHLEKIKEDIRDDIKRQSEQQSSYAIQYILSLSAIIGVCFAFITQVTNVSNSSSSNTNQSVVQTITDTTNAFNKPIIASLIILIMPYVSIYFTYLILYSIHSQQFQRRYLIKQIEPQLALLSGFESQLEWETYMEKEGKSGNVKSITLTLLFTTILWIICIAVPIFVWMVISGLSTMPSIFIYGIVIYIIIYVLIALYISWREIISLLNEFWLFISKLLGKAIDIVTLLGKATDIVTIVINLYQIYTVLRTENHNEQKGERRFAFITSILKNKNTKLLLGAIIGYLIGLFIISPLMFEFKVLLPEPSSPFYNIFMAYIIEAFNPTLRFVTSLFFALVGAASIAQRSDEWYSPELVEKEKLTKKWMGNSGIIKAGDREIAQSDRWTISLFEDSDGVKSWKGTAVLQNIIDYWELANQVNPLSIEFYSRGNVKITGHIFITRLKINSKEFNGFEFIGTGIMHTEKAKPHEAIYQRRRTKEKD